MKREVIHYWDGCGWALGGLRAKLTNDPAQVTCKRCLNNRRWYEAALRAGMKDVRRPRWYGRRHG